jgi:hypothetical protein
MLFFLMQEHRVPHRFPEGFLDLFSDCLHLLSESRRPGSCFATLRVGESAGKP